MIDLHPIVQPSFWFALAPGYLTSPFSVILFVLFAAVVVGGAVTRIVGRHKSKDKFARESVMKVGAMLITMGCLGLVWYFFTFEGVSFLGSRFWFLVWLIGAIVWSVVLYRRIRRDVPAMREKEMNRVSVNQYLPRRK